MGESEGGEEKGFSRRKNDIGKRKSGKEGNKEEVAGRRWTRGGMERERRWVAISSYNG